MSVASVEPSKYVVEVEERLTFKAREVASLSADFAVVRDVATLDLPVSTPSINQFPFSPISGVEPSNSPFSIDFF